MNPFKSPFILPVVKPVGMTSAQVVRYFKGYFSTDVRKLGHLGTLDPFASGVLLLAGNGASRLTDYIHSDLPKTYLACGRVDSYSQTGDREGPVHFLDQSEVFHKSYQEVKELLERRFQGEYWQRPPAFSATKHKGKPLYEYARQGILIEKEPVKRHLYSFEVIHFKYPYISFRVTASSGTYVRVLMEDLGKTLGSNGYLMSLVRESIGTIDLKQSLRRAKWPTKEKSSLDFNQYLLCPTSVLPYSRVQAGELATRFKNGGDIQLNFSPSLKNLYWVSGQEQCLGLAQGIESGSKLKPLIVYN